MHTHTHTHTRAHTHTHCKDCFPQSDHWLIIHFPGATLLGSTTTLHPHTHTHTHTHTHAHTQKSSVSVLYYTHHMNLVFPGFRDLRAVGVLASRGRQRRSISIVFNSLLMNHFEYLTVIMPSAESVLQGTEHKYTNTSLFLVLVQQPLGQNGAPFKVSGAFGDHSLCFLCKTLMSLIGCKPNALVQDETTLGAGGGEGG